MSVQNPKPAQRFAAPKLIQESRRPDQPSAGSPRSMSTCGSGSQLVRPQRDTGFFRRPPEDWPWLTQFG